MEWHLLPSKYRRVACKFNSSRANDSFNSTQNAAIQRSPAVISFVKPKIPKIWKMIIILRIFGKHDFNANAQDTLRHLSISTWPSICPAPGAASAYSGWSSHGPSPHLNSISSCLTPWAMQALVFVKLVAIGRVQSALFNTAVSTQMPLFATKRWQGLKTWIDLEKVLLHSRTTDPLVVLSKWHGFIFLRTADISSHKIFLGVIAKKGICYYTEQGLNQCDILCVIRSSKSFTISLAMSANDL